MDDYGVRIREQVMECMDFSRDMSDQEIETLIGEVAARVFQGNRTGRY